MSNVFTDTGGVLANQGRHRATVVSTKHIGRAHTKFGWKDFQLFVLRVDQTNLKTSEPESADIHVRNHRSFSPQSALWKLMAALGIPVRRGITFDFSTLVGMTLDIVVSHSTDAHGVVHAEVEPMLNGRVIMGAKK